MVEKLTEEEIWSLQAAHEKYTYLCDLPEFKDLWVKIKNTNYHFWESIVKEKFYSPEVNKLIGKL